MEKASGTKTSVHTGAFTDDYKFILLKDHIMLPTYAATGSAMSMLAARLSWFFNFTGPCVNLDSACSSSMMAFDLSCQGLRNREANMVMPNLPQLYSATHLFLGNRCRIQSSKFSRAFSTFIKYEFLLQRQSLL